MSAYQQRAPKPWNDEEPSREPPYATKSERPVYDVQMPPRRSNALVIYVAQEGPYTASFWTKGGVGGEIMVATRKTTGLINLQRGQWVSVKYIPFPLGEDDPLYIPHVKHEVIEIEEPRPGRLPLVTDINPMIQVETEIEFSPRLIEMSNFDSKGFRLAICPDMGNFYAAFPRTLETERWIDWFIRGLKKERNKSLKLRAKLCLPKCSSLCTNEIYWFVTSMYYGHREVQFGSIRDYYEGTFWPRQLDDYLFMSLNDINYEGDDSDDVAAFEDERQEATAPVHDQRALNRHLRGCSSMDQLKDFVDSYRQDFHNLLVNFDQNEAMVKKVKVAIVLLVEDLALCYSPIYGWCVVQRSVAGMGSAQFNRTFQQGKWLAVNLYPSKTDGRSYKVADWIACPTYYVCSNPPFNLFCLNADSETAIMEALAFGQVLQRVENDKGVRYLIVETELGEVWVPGSIEDPGMETEELVVTCPRNCYCNRQYRSYANPMEELDRLGNPVEDPTNWGPPQFNRRDSEGTIGRFMHEDQSGPAFQDRRSNRSMGRSDFGTEHYGRSRQQTNRERSPEISERYTRSNHHFSAERSRRNDQQRDEWSQERPTSTHNGYPHRSQERPTSVQNGYPHRSQERPTSAHNGYPHRNGNGLSRQGSAKSSWSHGSGLARSNHEDAAQEPPREPSPGSRAGSPRSRAQFGERHSQHSSHVELRENPTSSQSAVDDFHVTAEDLFAPGSKVFEKALDLLKERPFQELLGLRSPISQSPDRGSRTPFAGTRDSDDDVFTEDGDVHENEPQEPPFRMPSQPSSRNFQECFAPAPPARPSFERPGNRFQMEKSTIVSEAELAMREVLEAEDDAFRPTASSATNRVANEEVTVPEAPLIDLASPEVPVGDVPTLAEDKFFSDEDVISDGDEFDNQPSKPANVMAFASD